MTRRSMWQGILGWLRPADRGADVRDGAHRRAERGGSRHDRAHAGVGGDEGGMAAAEAVLSTGFPESELLEFLAADVDPVQADPVFREQLREELWTLVQDGAARGKGH